MNEPLTIGSRRRCDNCGRPYTVNRKDHRFDKSQCRSEFHRYGTPLLRLRPAISKETERMSIETEFRIFQVLELQMQRRYRQLFPARARQFDAMTAAAQENLPA